MDPFLPPGRRGEPSPMNVLESGATHPRYQFKRYRTLAAPTGSETLVPEKDDPVPEGPGLGEAQADLLRRRGKESLPLPDLDRVDVDAVLVDQVLAHEGRAQVPSSHHEIAPGPGLELLDLFPHHLPRDRGVPRRGGEGPRIDHLGHVAPD